MDLIYQPLVQEDLNVGTGLVWITSPASGELCSTQVGIHSVARGQKKYTTTWAPGSIAAGYSASTTLTVPDAAVGDFVMASHDKILTNDLQIVGNISASDTAQVVIHNPTSAAITVASGTLSVVVFPVITATSPSESVLSACIVWDISLPPSEYYTLFFYSNIVNGSGTYIYEWSLWSDGDGSESSPSQTSSAQYDSWVIHGKTGVTIKLVVTDDDSGDSVTIGPEVLGDGDEETSGTTCANDWGAEVTAAWESGDNRYLDLDSSIIGGAGPFTYVWSWWAYGYGDEDNPAETSTSADIDFTGSTLDPPDLTVFDNLPPYLVSYKLVVTDTATSQTFTHGPIILAW